MSPLVVNYSTQIRKSVRLLSVPNIANNSLGVGRTCDPRKVEASEEKRASAHLSQWCYSPLSGWDSRSKITRLQTHFL